MPRKRLSLVELVRAAGNEEFLVNDSSPDKQTPEVINTSLRAIRKTVQIGRSTLNCPKREAFFAELAAKRKVRQSSSEQRAA